MLARAGIVLFLALAIRASGQDSAPLTTTEQIASDGTHAFTVVNNSSALLTGCRFLSIFSLSIVLTVYAQTQIKTTFTALEAFVLSQPKSSVHIQLVGRLVDGPNSVTVSLVSAHSEDRQMLGLEFVVATDSKRDTVYMDQAHLNVFLKALSDGPMERARSSLLDQCRERGSSYGFDAFFSSAAGDLPGTHTVSAGWLFTGSQSLGTMIQVQSASAFLCPLPSTPLPEFLRLLKQGVSQLNNDL